MPRKRNESVHNEIEASQSFLKLKSLWQKETRHCVMNKCFFSNVENKRSTIRAQATMNNGDGVIATKPIQGCTELNRTELSKRCLSCHRTYTKWRNARIKFKRCEILFSLRSIFRIIRILFSPTCANLTCVLYSSNFIKWNWIFSNTVSHICAAFLRSHRHEKRVFRANDTKEYPGKYALKNSGLPLLWNSNITLKYRYITPLNINQIAFQLL